MITIVQYQVKSNPRLPNQYTYTRLIFRECLLTSHGPGGGSPTWRFRTLEPTQNQLLRPFSRNTPILLNTSTVMIINLCKFLAWVVCISFSSLTQAGRISALLSHTTLLRAYINNAVSDAKLYIFSPRMVTDA